MQTSRVRGSRLAESPQEETALNPCGPGDLSHFEVPLAWASPMGLGSTRKEAPEGHHRQRATVPSLTLKNTRARTQFNKNSINNKNHPYGVMYGEERHGGSEKPTYDNSLLTINGELKISHKGHMWSSAKSFVSRRLLSVKVSSPSPVLGLCSEKAKT